MNTAWEFYIDESGNTGDAALRPGKVPFGDQPTFVLAAIGKKTEDVDLDRFVQELRAKHHIQMPELKGTSLAKRKPCFIRDLIQFLVQNNYPLFIEVIDKKFHLVMNLVTFFLAIRGKYLSDPHETHDMRILADLIYEEFSEQVLEAYSTACLSRSINDLENFLRVFAKEADGKLASENDLAKKANMYDVVLRGMAKTQFFLTLLKEEEEAEEIVNEFLPPPDFNKRGEIIAMLPHVTTFSNVYARINSLTSENEALEVIHDEQAHFDEIIEDYHTDMSNNNLAHLDSMLDKAGARGKLKYTYGTGHLLRFSDSKDEVAIQVADVLAGFCRYYFETRLASTSPLRDCVEETADLLWKTSINPGSAGVLVVTTKKRALSTFVREKE